MARTSMWKRMCGFIRPDWMFAFLLLVSVMLLTLGMDGLDKGELAGWTKVLSVGGATLAAVFVAAFGQKLDRKLLDDYFYQIMAQSAVVALISTLVLFFMFDQILDGLILLVPSDLVAIMLGSWALGFFFYRIRGTNL